MNTYFLWPEPIAQYERYLIGGRISTTDIEEEIQALFPKSFPVLFSSARAGLTATLQLLGVGRPDIVWCPPYSCHAVQESIARMGSPSTTDVSMAKVALIYHQWGFVHRHAAQSCVTIIEDSVDTFFLPGANLFACGGRFALWSLPKVISSTWGGVVFCQIKGDAERLRAIRNDRYGFQMTQALLRMVSEYSNVAYKYWHGNESLNGSLPTFALRQIRARLKDIPVIAERRIQLLDVVRSAEIYFQMDEGRLPSNIPLIPPVQVEKWWGPGNLFSAGTRSINSMHNYAKVERTMVAPLPVHQDISESVLNSIPLNIFEGVK